MKTIIFGWPLIGFINDMGVLEYIIIIAIVLQILFCIQVINNFRYAMNKYKRPRRGYRPQCVLIVPCKGLDETFDKNIESFFLQEYENYHLCFVVEDFADPAYERLLGLKARHAQVSHAASVQILVSGQSDSCSQKLHNLLHGYHQIPDSAEALVFADSDACAGPNWLAHLVYPLRQEEKIGAASGYRCFVPGQNNAATVVLAAINAKICELLGNTRFNLAWGGSMAILVKTFRELNLDKTWQKVLSDDLSLSCAVRKKGLKMTFVPACMIASYETTTWPKLIEFARRQFVITRIYTPGMWLFGLFSALFSVLGLWGGAALALWAKNTGYAHANLCVLLPVVFLVCQFTRAVLRQTLIAKLLPNDKDRLKVARYADILFFWFFTLILLFVILISAVGRTITWRNITYKLRSPTDIQILSGSD
ncbi:MAG: glycosyltransferase family 2 protein [Deltaproteobacteria bacterium]|nr:glycosyltransferase family 2 protein [Deltaproteobacteria bacterium]